MEHYLFSLEGSYPNKWCLQSKAALFIFLSQHKYHVSAILRRGKKQKENA